MISRRCSLYPHRAVRENLAFPLRSPVLNLPAEPRFPGGGRRVSTGRTLIRRPRFHLMGARLSSLVARLRAEPRLELKRIQRETDATPLYVTHDRIEAMTMTTHVGAPDERSPAQFGPQREIHANPVNIHVAARRGERRVGTPPAGLFDPAPEGAATIGYRRGQSRVREGRGVSIARAEHPGGPTRPHRTRDGHEIATPADALRPGAGIFIPPRDALCLYAAGARIR